jgi:diguanylate cyclase (GGDEF)-like protein
MAWGLVRLLLAWVGAGVLLIAAGPALAINFPSETTCHATARLDQGYDDLSAEPWRWDCEAKGWSIDAPRTFLRFDLRGANREIPSIFVTRLTRFDAMRLTVVDADGRTASRDVTEADMVPATTDWLMHTTLPRIGGDPEAVIVRIDGARHAGMLSDARLIESAGDTPASLRHELLIAALCGMLLLPLLFNFAFYRVLRERFLLWHAAVAGLMLVHTLVTSGLINRFASLSLTQLSIVSSLTVGGAIIAASFFSADFIETGKLSVIHRRLLRYAAFWVAPWTAFYLFAEGALRPFAAPLYLASYLPLMAVFIWAMAVAKRRGSRAVNFQIAAWTPVMLTALVRIGSALGLTDAPVEVLIEQHFAMGFEVIITSLGVADRFMAIRRERDRAWAQSRRLEALAERDPLTGLFNRRGIEERFGELHAEGFHAMAVIDLDHFKRVNDVHGHATGDEVLRAAAQGLAPDDDTLAVRMGGEEFLLLLRGKDVAARAERRRQAIALRVAADVAGLQGVVTASMGLVEQPPSGTLKADFATLYSHCDRLLYEAKNTGRNRTMSAKLQSFGPRPKRAKAAA